MSPTRSKSIVRLLASRGPLGLLALAIVMSTPMMLGQAWASPWQSVIQHLTGHAPGPPPGVIAQARCYGRYLAWRDALSDAIQTTNAWPTSAEPVNEFEKMQASFTADLADERGLVVRAAPDIDETGLPRDIRVALDRGLQESKARLAAASARAERIPARDDATHSGGEQMAKLQSAMEGAFAELRAPCVQFLEKHKPRHAPPTQSASYEEPPSGDAPPNPGQETDPPAEAAGDWVDPQWIQVGVFGREVASADKLRELRSRWPRETVGLTEKTESINRHGKMEHVALVGPFVSVAEARAFCEKLATLGSACKAQPSVSATSVRRRGVLLTSRRRGCGAQRRAGACQSSVTGDRTLSRASNPAPRPSASPGAIPVSNQNAQDMDAGLRGRLTE